MTKKILIFSLVFVIFVSACNPASNPTPVPPEQTTAAGSPPAVATATLTPTPEPPRQLTVCMPGEPESLFLYGSASQAARAAGAAIYDGPFDQLDYTNVPVILENLPGQATGDASLAPVQAALNDLIVDSQGNLANLVEGVGYLPSGCTSPACAQTYSGQEPVTMDQLVVRFKLLPGLQWSDGAPLTADDSLYSFEVARALGTRARADIRARTYSYQAVDAQTVEWRGVPGWHDPDLSQNFFDPLPRHAWGGLTASQLLTDTLSTRSPLGWGAYTVAEWAPGDRLILNSNPNYYRTGESLPHFDTLVFRFIRDGAQALAALQAGACDLLDPAYAFTPQDAALQELQQAGQALVAEIPAVAWEHLDFGISFAVADPQRPAFFQVKEVRQAVAQCIDRVKLAQEFAPTGTVLDSYVPPDHPLYAAEVRKYTFDPAAAGALLTQSGWLDTDNDPATPRLSLGAPGVVDGTPFSVSLQTSDEPQRQRLAQLIQESLAQCGIQVEIVSAPLEQVFAAGPDGPVFGRQFSLAQFAWPVTSTAACALFTTQQIPGPYPEYPRSWGGANASGYSSPAFDQACLEALNSPADSPERLAAAQQAQAIFAEDLPVLPLFLRSRWVVARPDFCGLQPEPANANPYWNIESFNYGENCQ